RPVRHGVADGPLGLAPPPVVVAEPGPRPTAMQRRWSRGGTHMDIDRPSEARNFPRKRGRGRGRPRMPAAGPVAAGRCFETGENFAESERNEIAVDLV